MDDHAQVLPSRKVIVATIPAEMKALRQWIGWRYEVRGGKRTKVPINPHNGLRASSTKPLSWGSLDEALAAVERYLLDGVGFVLSSNDPFFGVDLDACRNPETNELTPWAQEIVDMFPGYWEISPSGYGLKFVGRGKLRIRSRNVKKLKDVPTYGDKSPEIAVFDDARYWCITGELSAGALPTCEPCQEQLDSLVAKLFPEKRTVDKRPRGDRGDRTAKQHGDRDLFPPALEQLLTKCASAPAGDRSEIDFQVCLSAIRHGIDREAVWSRVKIISKFSERGRDYFDLTWGNAAQNVRPIICNAERVGSGKDAKLHGRTMPEIIDQTNTITENWPRRVRNSLFIDDPVHGLHQFRKASDLFGYLHSKAQVLWLKTPGCVTKDEYFCELQRTAPAYRAIESFPHFPPLAGHYYSHPSITPGDGTALRHLVGQFCPTTTIDGDLILALFASAAWGGDGGTRPAFAIVSDDGRGVGKSKLIEIVGQLFGGYFAIDHNDRAFDIRKRLLTPEAATKRITLFDNVKTNRLSWGEYESLITCRDISGHRMYAGEGTRPNTLLWCMTLNGPSMSRDMAQRSVMIKLNRPTHSATWEDSIKAFVEAERWRIMADLAAFFNRSAENLARHSRWGSWEREVLARLPEPSDAQKVILERQNAVNADDEESADITDFFRQQLEKLQYNTDVDNVHIPNELALCWVRRATGSFWTTNAVTRHIRQAHKEGTMEELMVNPSRSGGRGLLWVGYDGRETARVTFYDIEDRQQWARGATFGAER